MDLLQKILAILDAKDRRNLYRYVALNLLNGILLIAGVSLVIPFVTLLLSPEKLSSLYFIGAYNYKSAVIISVALIITTFFVKNICLIIFLSYQTRILMDLSYKVAKKMFNGYLYAPYSLYMRRNSAEIIRNINVETTIFITHIISPLGVIITDAICTFAGFIFLLYFNWQFSIWLAATFGVVLPIFTLYMRDNARQYAAKRSAAWGNMTKYALYGIGSIKEITVFGKRKGLSQMFNQMCDVAQRASNFDNLYRNTPRMVIESFAISSILLFVLLQILYGVDGTQIMKSLSVLGVTAMVMLPCLNRIMTSLSMIKYGRKSIDIISSELKFLQVDREFEKENIQFNEKICFNNVSFAYDNTPCLKNISFCVKKGEKVAFVGKSGAGKSTLIDIMLGILDGYAGNILIDDHVLEKKHISSWHQKISYIPQRIYLLDESISANIALNFDTNNYDPDKVWAALEQAQLKEFVESLPQQLETIVGDNGIKLSGGQRQRLGIARALYNNPEILIMDEATSSLDGNTEYMLMRSLEMAYVNRTVIIVAHRLSTVKNCDKIFVVDRGSIISSGTYDELRRDCKIFNSIHKEDLTKEFI